MTHPNQTEPCIINNVIAGVPTTLIVFNISIFLMAASGYVFGRSNNKFVKVTVSFIFASMFLCAQRLLITTMFGENGNAFYSQF